MDGQEVVLQPATICHNHPHKSIYKIIDLIVLYFQMLRLDVPLPIIYADDFTYRERICDIFDVPEDGDDFDFEARFQYIYKETLENAFFQEAFKTAAGFMISEDPLTGACILCAYDYLAVFYAAYVAFIKGGKLPDFSEKTSTDAAALLEKITRK